MAHKRSQKNSQIIASLDLGATKICALIAEVVGDSLGILGYAHEPSMGVRKGVVVNIPLTVNAIKKAKEGAEHMAGLPMTSSYVGISGHHIKSFNSNGVVAIKSGEVTPHDVERALDAARAVAIGPDREILHIVPQEFAVNDHEGVKDPLGMNGVRLESKVHIITASEPLSLNTHKCLNQAGIQVEEIVLESLAAAECALSPDEKELGVVLVDIGGSSTNIIIFSEGSVVYTSVIHLGASHITHDIAVGLRTSIQDAEAIKLKEGCAMTTLIDEERNATGLTEDIRAGESFLVSSKGKKEVSRSVLARIIEPRMEEILNLIHKEITASGYRSRLSAGVVLTGGGSLLEGICELSEFVLEMPVRRSINSPKISGVIDLIHSPIYTTALGLLIYGWHHKKDPNYHLKHESNFYTKLNHRVKSFLGDFF